MVKEKLENCFPEFEKYIDQCRFIGCAHMNEPDCAVKEALESGKISNSRYENYKLMYRELKEKEMIKMSPSILSADFANLGADVKKNR